MPDISEAERNRSRESLVGTLLLLLFGCSVLAFLVAVDRAEWFAIRPATGTSVAMSQASVPQSPAAPISESAIAKQ